MCNVVTPSTEDGGDIFLWNIYNKVQVYMATQFNRTRPEQLFASMLWKRLTAVHLYKNVCYMFYILNTQLWPSRHTHSRKMEVWLWCSSSTILPDVICCSSNERISIGWHSGRGKVLTFCIQFGKLTYKLQHVFFVVRGGIQNWNL